MDHNKLIQKPAFQKLTRSTTDKAKRQPLRLRYAVVLGLERFPNCVFNIASCCYGYTEMIKSNGGSDSETASTERRRTKWIREKKGEFELQHLIRAVSAVMVSVTFPSTSNAAAIGAGKLTLWALTRHCRGHTVTHTVLYLEWQQDGIMFKKTWLVTWEKPSCGQIGRFYYLYTVVNIIQFPELKYVWISKTS